MLAVLFGLSVRELGDLVLPNGKLINLSGPRLLHSTDPGFYYIKIQNRDQLHYLDSLDIEVTSASILSHYWVCVFLTGAQASSLSANSTFYLSKVSMADKLQRRGSLHSTGRFIIYADSSFSAPPSARIHRLSRHFFQSSRVTDDLLSDPRVLSVYAVSHPRLLNR
jgi:hypothetical protein